MNNAFRDEWMRAPLSRLVARIAELAAVDQVLRMERRELEDIVHERLGTIAQAQRTAAGKQTGTVRFDADGYTVIADLPKRTEYDQKKLAAAIEALKKWGENPADYVSFEIKVSEAKYQAWPPAVRALFEPARTVKTGKPSYQFQPSDVTSPVAVVSTHLSQGAQ
ncbi:hypothetical protein [Yanghanlia caeni]|uniref:Uncharacterized protein n=1 Tax=Yanghanlia caeni TaxID=3064283 RepID=A0ABU1D539_9BURK|nr:hypothetical protein [Alcaligenaceae bacterium LG-2]